MKEHTGTPPKPEDAERELFDVLRAAAWIFEKEKNGRFQGSKLACQAVARFVHQRDWGPELAAPFLQIAIAFDDLEKGGKPRLFSKKTVGEKERERSPERKHIQMLAAAALEVLMKYRDDRAIAAAEVARAVNSWPGMSQQEITGNTVIAWRNNHRGMETEERRTFDRVREALLGDADPETKVTELLKSGPLGFWKS